MPTFIELSNCKGIAPEKLRNNFHVMRPHIIGELLKDRTKARFVLGPAGYGKKSIAFEYAQLMFEFKHVFWVDATSPCFIRDLDAHSIWKSILNTDKEVKLVVFEGINSLDSERAENFGTLINDIISAQCEVLVTCTPSACYIAENISDSTVVMPSQLHLTPEELETESARGNLSLIANDNLSEAEKAPGLVWSKTGREDVIAQIAKEMLPASIRFLIFCILVMQKGNLQMLNQIACSNSFDDDIEFLEKYYPFLGIDLLQSTFNSLDIACPVIKSKGGFTQNELLSIMKTCNRREMIPALSDALISNNRSDRTLEFLKTFASKDVISDWASTRGWSMIFKGHYLLVAQISEFVRGESTRIRTSLDALCTWSYSDLSKLDLAKKIHHKVMVSTVDSWIYKCSTSVMLALKHNALEFQNALDVLQIGTQLFDYDSDEIKQHIESSPVDFYELCARSKTILENLAIINNKNAKSKSNMLNVMLSEALSSNENNKKLAATILVVSWALLRVCALSEDKKPLGAFCQTVDSLVELVNDYYSEQINTRINTIKQLPQMIIYDVERAIEMFCKLFPGVMSAELAQESDTYHQKISALIQESSIQYQNETQLKAKKTLSSALTRPDSPKYDKAIKATSSRLRAAIPLLEINLFGGFDARIADKVANSRVLTRKKARMTLIILMLNKGREVSRERLTEALWPESDYVARQRNFYVVWADLKRALSIDDECPYLIKTQTGYSLNSRYVKSDIDGFDNLCQDLLFGEQNMSVWKELFDRASNDYSEDLLPGYTENEYINTTRKRLKVKLVEGLIAASFRMAKYGEYRGAIWFAREAIRRDPTREDAYIALMEAQLQSDQRGAALETYFDCRTHLVEMLGIDPCTRVMDIYRSIIETEAVF